MFFICKLMFLTSMLYITMEYGHFICEYDKCALCTLTKSGHLVVYDYTSNVICFHIVSVPP